YQGNNSVPAHHLVVRAMPGGFNGLALTEKRNKSSVSLDLDDLRKQWKKYWADMAKANEGFAGKKEGPLELKNLRVAAFIQNDKTKEVLQATQVDISAEE